MQAHRSPSSAPRKLPFAGPANAVRREAVPLLGLRGITRSLRAPTLRDLIYATKAFIASALALMVGFGLNLENPYWAVLTVYIIVNPPGAGAIRAKCLFRFVGTIIGGILVVAATGLFGDQLGILLTATIAIIVGALFFNQVDKTPTSYTWFAIAVTTAVIALSNLVHPDRIFDLATARVGEISLGILMTAAVDCFWSEPMTPAFIETMADWRRKAAEFALGTLELTGDPSGSDRRSKLQNLLKGIHAIDSKAIQLPFDLVPRAPRKRDLDLVRRQVVAITGSLIAMELHARPLDGTKAASTFLADPDPVRSWLRAAPPLSNQELDAHIAEGQMLADDIEAAGATPSKRDVPVERGLATHFVALIRDLCDLSLAMRGVQTNCRLPRRLKDIAARAKPVRSIDYLGAALDLTPVVLAMTVTSAIWYLTAWEDGPTALLFSFAGCVFLVGQAQILESTGGFLACVLIAFGLVFAYQFVILPRVTDFVPLVMVLGCALIPLGVLMAMSMAGMLIATLTFSFLGLQNAYAADFSQSLQTLVGSLVGLLVAVISLRVCAYDHARFTERRLAAAVRQDVVDVARARRLPDRERFRFLALYRLSLYFSAIEPAPDDDRPTRELLDDLLVGHNILALRFAKPSVSAAARDMIETLCRKTAATYRRKLARRDGEILAFVEDAISKPALRSDSANEVLLEILASLALSLGASSVSTREPTVP